jgi:hypothetical protein
LLRQRDDAFRLLGGRCAIRQDELVCMTVYKHRATQVVRRLAA